MGNCIGKNGFRKTDEFKEREETKGKETAKPFDPIKNAAHATKKKEITETSKPIVNDQSQHSDVGSSSDSRTIEDIPANFERIGGNTDLANAKVILFGENHILQHQNNIVDFINTYAADNDIVLVEGLRAGNKMDGMVFLQAKATRLGVNEAKKEEIMLFEKNFDVRGCDDVSANRRQHTTQSKKEKIYEDFINGTSSEGAFEKLNELERLYDELAQKREEEMIKTINEMKKNFPDKRIFTIVGKNHALKLLEKIKNQEYIALEPTYKMTREEENSFDIKLYEQAKRRRERFTD